MQKYRTELVRVEKPQKGAQYLHVTSPWYPAHPEPHHLNLYVGDKLTYSTDNSLGVPNIPDKGLEVYIKAFNQSHDKHPENITF